MAKIFTAQVRLTHRYIDSYSGNDQWGEYLQFKELAGRIVDDGNGYDSLETMTFRVIGSKTKDQKLQAKALRDHYSYGGCTHEYDCCGCHSVTAYVTPIKRGIFSVTTRHSRNF